MFAWTALQGTTRQFRVTVVLVVLDAAFFEADYTQSSSPEESRPTQVCNQSAGIPQGAVAFDDMDTRKQHELKVRVGPVEVPVAYTAVLHSLIEIALHWSGAAPISILLQCCCARRRGRINEVRDEAP